MQLVVLAKAAAVVQISRMRSLPKTGLVAAPLVVLLALGCQASIDDGHKGSGSGGSSAGGAQNLGGGVALPPGTQAAALLPARIRRFADAEYQATVSSLIGSGADGISVDFVPDSRQGGFTLNEAQRVDPVFARQLSEAAIALAADLRKHVTERAPCQSPTVAAEADKCADGFIRSFGQKAYRRALRDDEVTQLMTVFHAAYEGGSYDEGIELVVRAMLQSAAFLYLTEIGDAPASTIKLTQDELASSVSYLVQGGPPSDALLKAAHEGKLDTPEARAASLADPELGLFIGAAAQARVVRVIREWLGTDKISQIAKDSNQYPKFTAVKGDLESETTAFLSSLVSVEHDGGSLRQLLAADWTVPTPALAEIYEATGAADPTTGRVSVPSRLGILHQGAFLSVFAHAQDTAPVLRGVAVMRRVACDLVADPVDLKMAVVPPAPDSSKSTRDRFAAHATPGCAYCHDRIDNYGFAFEDFDAMGQIRLDDGGHALDTNVVVAGTDFAGSYPDSNALVKAMSTSPQVRECFARHVFRALAATSAPELAPSEDDFVKYWGTTTAGPDGKVDDVYIIGTLTAFITSPSFNYRRAQ